MSEQSADEQRLRATEAQMWRALGLGNSSPARVQTADTMAPPIATGTGHAHRRHFVRDGEVPVTVVHHDDAGGTNRLDEARQALREQIAAREQVERQLAEAQAAIQALQTQLAHELIANEEALRRGEDERQQVEHQLGEERAARQQAEQERDAAVVSRLEAEERLRQIMEAQQAQAPVREPPRVRKPVTAKPKERGSAGADAVLTKGSEKMRKQRGQPAKVRDAGSEFVEWWKPGWRDRFR